MAWCTTVRAVSERSDSMLEMHGEGHGFIAVNFPIAETLDKKRTPPASRDQKEAR